MRPRSPGRRQLAERLAQGLADDLSTLEEGDHIFSERLRRQMDKASLFVEEEEEMQAGGAPLPGS